MTAKIVTFGLTFLISAAIGAGLFVVLIIALNGFSERDATWAIGVYIGGAFLLSAIVSALAAFALGPMLKREMKPFVSIALAVVVFSFIGGILTTVLIFVSALVAEIVRTSR